MHSIHVNLWLISPALFLNVSSAAVTCRIEKWFVKRWDFETRLETIETKYLQQF